MRFDSYFKERVDEKVSKTEVEGVLRNPNIIIGAEFEFIHDFLENYEGGGSGGLGDEYEAAVRDYDTFNKEWREFEEERQEMYSKQRRTEERFDELDDDLIPETEGEITDLEEKIAENVRILADIENDFVTNSDTFGELTDDRRAFKTERKEELIFRLKGYKKYLKKAEELLEKYEEEKSALDVDKDDIQNEIDDYEYPAPGYRYNEYMEMIQSQYDVGDGVPEYWFEDGDIPEPPSPEYMELGGDLGNEDTWIEAVQENFNEIFGDFPLNVDIRVTGYHDQQQKMGDNYWKAESDASIADEGGIELISPPMTLPEFVKICPKVFAWINRIGSTTSSTGFHVHMSLAGVDDLMKELDPIKLTVMTDEGYIWKFFEGREFNSYVQNTKRALAQRGVTSDDMQRLVNHKKLERKLNAGHSDSISFANWEKGHIEFRQMGGNDYAKKWNEVKATVAMNGHNLSIACDDTYKQEEYQRRLYRIANKMDNMRYDRYVSWIGEFIYQLDRIRDNFSNLTPEEQLQIKAARQLVMRHRDTVRKLIQSAGGLPDKDIRLIMKNSFDFVRESEKYSHDKLTDLIGKTKLASMDRLIVQLTPYINYDKLKK